jgi:hypothetical protein
MTTTFETYDRDDDGARSTLSSSPRGARYTFTCNEQYRATPCSYGNLTSGFMLEFWNKPFDFSKWRVHVHGTRRDHTPIWRIEMKAPATFEDRRRYLFSDRPSIFSDEFDEMAVLLTMGVSTGPAKKRIIDDYGCVDISRSVPNGFTHVGGLRLTVTAKRLGIRAYPAIISWGKKYPNKYGVVVTNPSDAQRLIQARDARVSP